MPGRINQLILKVAELCNINCSYCYLYKHGDQGYRFRPKFMSEEVFEQVLVRVREYCDCRDNHRMTLIFHGGEPMLLGRARLTHFAERAREVLDDRLDGLVMQTNGTLIDAEWLKTIRECQIQVGVSLDGPASIHDANRVDFAGRGSHAAVTRALQMLQDGGMSPSVLCVVNPSASGSEIYRHFRSLEVREMDFLLPDVTHDTRERFYGEYHGTPVAKYLISIFDEWFSEDDPEVKVRLFRSLISALLGGQTESDTFGNPLSCYLIIETDGSIQANDVLRICAQGMSESGLNIFDHSFDDLSKGLPMLHQVIHEGIRLSETCEVCPERDICGGGYLPHRFSKTKGFDNPSVWCADILQLIAHIRSRIDNACRVQS